MTFRIIPARAALVFFHSSLHTDTACEKRRGTGHDPGLLTSDHVVKALCYWPFTLICDALGPAEKPEHGRPSFDGLPELAGRAVAIIPL